MFAKASFFVKIILATQKYLNTANVLETFALKD